MIEIQQLSKCYQSRSRGRVQALDAVDLRAEAGKVHALLGPNGSGKTTLLRTLPGLLTPDQGQVRVMGHCAQSEAALVRRRLGFLTGSMKMPRRLTPREVLFFFGRLRGMAQGHLAERVEQVLDRLGMAGFADRRMEHLSMGQKQRTGVAHALLADPEVLVLDEVTVGMDVLAAREILEWVRELADEGKTVLFSTHIMGEVTVLADQVSILHQGRVIYDGTLEQLDGERQASSLEDEFIRRLREA